MVGAPSIAVECISYVFRVCRNRPETIGTQSGLPKRGKAEDQHGVCVAMAKQSMGRAVQGLGIGL